MILKAYSNSGDSLKNSKRVYLKDIEVHTICPECKENVVHDNCSPFLNNNDDGTSYISHLYCPHCDYESDEKLYKLNSINEDSIDVEFDKKFETSVYQLVLQKIKID